MAAEHSHRFFTGCGKLVQYQSRAGDLDGDGALDLAVANYSSNTVSILINQGVVPVELTTFTASIEHTNAELKWKTATETNNYGFEVERRRVGELKSREANESKQSLNGSSAQWLKIGFVAGAGTSNSPHDYAFSDQKLSDGRYAYRIKQIDNGGSFKYSGSVEVDIKNMPTIFSLDQNYPNPFNPTTRIRFSLPVRSRVKLEVFNILGQIVAKLMEGEKGAGFVEAVWHANVASGLYIYRLEAISSRQSK